MEYTTLGKSDLKVSRICMGCMGLGDPSKGMNKYSGKSCKIGVWADKEPWHGICKSLHDISLAIEKL